MSPNTPKKKQVIPHLHSMEVGGFVQALLSSIVAADVPNAPNIPLAPERILMRVSPSVVVVDVMDAHGKSIGQGSGVVIGADQVVTACHVVKEAAKEGKHALVRKSGKTFKATLQYADPNRNICQLNVNYLEATPIILGSAKKIRVGQHIYAIGVSGGARAYARQRSCFKLAAAWGLAIYAHFRHYFSGLQRWRPG